MKLNHVTAILLITDSMFLMSSAMLGPIFAVFVLSLGGDIRHIGEITGIYGVIYGFASYFVSKYYLHYKHELLTLSYFFWFIYSAFLFSTHSIFMLYVIQSVGGFARALRGPAFSEVMYHSFGKDDVTRANTVYKLIGNILAAICAIVSGHLSHTAGIKVVFTVMALIALTSVILSISHRRIIPK